MNQIKLPGPPIILLISINKFLSILFPELNQLTINFNSKNL